MLRKQTLKTSAVFALIGNPWLLAVLVVSASCSEMTSPTAPPPPPAAANPVPPPAPGPPVSGPLAGNWVGAFESSNYATRSIELNLVQTDASMSITGTWAFPGAGQGQGGTISGSVDRGNFVGSISYYGNHDADCRAVFSGTASNAALNWSSAGFTGICGLSATTGNPFGIRLILQRP